MKRTWTSFLLSLCITTLAFSDEYSEMKELLTAETGGDIEYLSRIELGIPGGDNWIAIYDEFAYIYTVNHRKEIKKIDNTNSVELSEIVFWDSENATKVPLEFDIMRDIPGTHIENRATAFGDYNGDGKDEVFCFVPGNGDDCWIWGYDDEKDAMSYYFSCPYVLIDRNGPSPAEFVNYKGIDGIKVYLENHMEERYYWLFFAWDEGSREYVKLAEIGQDIDYSKFTPSVEESETRLPDIELQAALKKDDEQLSAVESLHPTVDDEPEVEQSGRFPLPLIIAGFCAVLLGAIFAVIAAKRKKRGD